jgi:hypothetical protein
MREPSGLAGCDGNFIGDVTPGNRKSDNSTCPKIYRNTRFATGWLQQRRRRDPPLDASSAGTGQR